MTLLRSSCEYLSRSERLPVHYVYGIDMAAKWISWKGFPKSHIGVWVIGILTAIRLIASYCAYAKTVELNEIQIQCGMLSLSQRFYHLFADPNQPSCKDKAKAYPSHQ